MAIQRMDHVGIVLTDMAAATAFFVELGLTPVGSGEVEGAWVDRIIGVDGVRSGIAMLETPDGRSRLELSSFHTPPAPDGDPQAPANVPGLRHVCFAVDDVEDTVMRLKAHGGELVGTIERYGDVYKLCYLRGPEGIIVELAEEIR